jgi:hypothetical protein
MHLKGMKLWLFAAALIASFLLLACNGGGDDDDGDNGDAAPTATEEAADGDGDGETGDASQEIQELAGQWAERDIKIAYNFSSTAAGTTSSGTMTLYWKPPDWRMDFDLDGSTGTIISAGGTSYFCSESGGEGQCLESPVESAAPIPFLSSFTDPGEFNSLVTGTFSGVDVDRSERTIAGQDARCYSVSSDIAGAEGDSEYCFSEDGVVLLISFSGGATGDFSLEATSVEGEVADADLEPPYEVLDIGAP